MVKLIERERTKVLGSYIEVLQNICINISLNNQFLQIVLACGYLHLLGLLSIHNKDLRFPCCLYAYTLNNINCSLQVLASGSPHKNRTHFPKYPPGEISRSEAMNKGEPFS